MNWYPQALFTNKQDCRRHFLFLCKNKNSQESRAPRFLRAVAAGLHKGITKGNIYIYILIIVYTYIYIYDTYICMYFCINRRPNLILGATLFSSAKGGPWGPGWAGPGPGGPRTGWDPRGGPTAIRQLQIAIHPKKGSIATAV